MIHPTPQGPIQFSVIHGKPLSVRGRTLTPVARVISSGSHVGTVRERGFEGRGWAVQIIQPIKVIEERDGKTQTLVIPAATQDALRKMAVLSIAVAAVSIIVILVARISRA